MSPGRRSPMHVDLGHGHGGARAKAKIVKMLSSLQVPCTRARGTAHRLDLGEGRRSVVGVRARVVTARTKARVLRSDVLYPTLGRALPSSEGSVCFCACIVVVAARTKARVLRTTSPTLRTCSTGLLAGLNHRADKAAANPEWPRPQRCGKARPLW